MKKILIIEDDARIASALQIRFQSQGYETWNTVDPVLGLAQIIAYKPDLVLLDIGLPGGDGLDVARKLRAQPETRNTPFIFVTASKDPDLRRKAMELGAAGLLEKPYDAGELLDLARYAMGDTQSLGRTSQDSPPAHRNPVSTGKRILVVEDDEKIAMALTIRLKAAGYETAIAADALAAVSTAVKTGPDLVLLDVSMPAGNGFLVAERLQKLVPRPLPLIFLTASKEPGLREKARSLGACGFFEKPFEATDLLNSIRQALLN